MFERLATSRTFGQWLKAPLREAVRSDKFHSNDNQPGIRLPAGQRRRPQQALACHWIPTGDGAGLECRWQMESDEDWPTSDGGDQFPRLAAPPLAPVGGATTAPERVVKLGRSPADCRAQTSA